jgi:opacity protein-like surface antigen
MKSYLRTTAAAVALLAGVGTAGAGQLYVSVFGGANWGKSLDPASGGGGVVNSSRTEVVTHTAPFSHPHTLAFVFTAVTNFNMTGGEAETGFVVGASVGRDYDNIIPGLRMELEGSFRRNNLGLAAITGGATDTDIALSGYIPGGNILHPASLTPQAPLVAVGPNTAFAGGTGTFGFAADFVSNFSVADEGKVQTWALMANAWFDIGNSSTFTPYVGGGIGYAISKFDGGAVYSGVDGSFAWQLGAGVNVAVSDTMSLGLGYRYFDAGDVELTLATPSGTPATAEQDVRGSSALLQLTHKFN